MNTENKPATGSTPPVHIDDIILHSEMLRTYLAMNQKFRMTCRQLKVLTSTLTYLQCRYDRAVRDNLRSFRYSMRLRMTTLEGVQNMYYEFAERCASRLEDMQVKLERPGLLPDDDGNPSQIRSLKILSVIPLSMMSTWKATDVFVYNTYCMLLVQYI